MKKHIKTIVALILGAIAFAAGFAAFAQSLKADIGRELAAARPSDGIGRVQAADAELYAAPAEQAGEGTALRVWCETDEDLPEWWNPESAEVVYTAPGPVRDIASPDWNLNTALWGWDGHMMEVWEFDLFVRIVYLEFYGTSKECVEAGADSILRLWESGYFGRTIGETIMARAENGALVYTTFGYVCDAYYYADGLEEIRAICEDRFYNGPQWCAEFFQLYDYPAWAQPCYEIDGVYFSTFKEGTR